MGRITTACIDKIMDAIRIEEVVGDFVTLKKSGSSFRGMSPFTNEKTPSFYVVPSKQIFKDFSSGKGGSAVSFLMEHEQMSYPEALRWIAEKYQIEIEEEEQSQEQMDAQSERESLIAVTAFAAKQFTEWLWEHDKGKAIGLTYFRNRGFTDEIIKSFMLGYALEARGALHDAAIKSGFVKAYLVKSGLCIDRENGSPVDRFWGRVMFPIHNMAGRIIGFGGRVLDSQAKTAKYLNSPESDIYHKSKVLYGLYQAKQAIAKKDRCLIVEGYTDVLAMHQAGVQHVVSSSGTALGLDQIRLIKRLTNNVTLLFDGDAAGLRASFRGIDLLLAEGLLVRAVPLPEGADPDSLAQSMDAQALQAYLTEHEQDFMVFKSDILLAEAGDDPIERAEAKKDLALSLSKIPNPILREEYVRATARKLGMDEQTLHDELSRLQAAANREVNRRQPQQAPTLSPVEASAPTQRPPAYEESLMKALIQHGETAIEVPDPEQEGKTLTEKSGTFIIEEVLSDNMDFSHAPYQQLFDLISHAWDERRHLMTSDELLRYPDQSLVSLVADLHAEKYQLAQWEKKEIMVANPLESLSLHIQQSILRFKEATIDRHVKDIIATLQATDDSDKQALLEKFGRLQTLRNALREQLRRVV